jgi:hypothetical protein
MIPVSLLFLFILHIELQPTAVRIIFDAGLNILVQQQ